MLNFTLDHDLSINGVSSVRYGNAYNCIKIDPQFDFNDFRVNFDMDVITWIDDERADCIIDRVNVSAWAFERDIVEVDVNVYGHDVDYGMLNPDFVKTIDCCRTIENTILYRMVTEIVKTAAGIAAYEVTQGITYDWSLDGF